MTQKSYDQRLRERWKRREGKAYLLAEEKKRDFERMMQSFHSAKRIVPLLIKNK